MITITVPINPVPASRPRVSKWGTYYLKTYKTFRKEVKPLIEELARGLYWPFDGPIAVGATFIVRRPKTTKLDYPNPDIDNYLKAIFDAGNGHLWVDDKQIVTLDRVDKRWAEPGEPGYLELKIRSIDE